MSQGASGEVKKNGKDGNACLPCSRAETNETATMFCFECQEYMCDMCARYHKRNKLTFRHQVTSINKLQSDQFRIALFSSDEIDLQVTCKLHTYKKFKYICQKHKKLCCSRCVIEHHRSCKEVVHLQDYTSCEDFKSKLHTNELNLSRLEQNANKLISYEIEHVESVRNHEKQGIEIGNVVRKRLLSKIESTFGDRSKAIKAKADDIVVTSEKLQTDTRKCLAEIQKYQSLQDRAQQHGSNANKVVTVTAVAECASNMKKQLMSSFANISRKSLVTELHLDELEEDISAISQIKELELTKGIPKFVGAPVLSSTMKVSVKDKTKPPCLRECCILDCGLVVATDENAKIIRLFDMQNGKEIKGYTFDSYPWGIAQIDENKVAVSLPSKKTIVLLTYNNNTMANETTIETESGCWGIAAYKKESQPFLAAFSKDNLTLNLIDIRRKNTEKVDIAIKSRVCLSHISNIATNVEIDHVYLSCFKEHKVFACNFKGEIIWQISHRLHTPMGLCVDTINGEINICSFESHEILRVSFTGDSLGVLVPKQDLNGPVALAYMNKHGTLVVCDHEPGNIQIKTFSTEGK